MQLKTTQDETHVETWPVFAEHDWTATSYGVALRVAAILDDCPPGSAPDSSDRHEVRAVVSRTGEEPAGAAVAGTHLLIVSVDNHMMHVAEHASREDAQRDGERAILRAMRLRRWCWFA